jgi:hypothetical protein
MNKGGWGWFTSSLLVIDTEHLLINLVTKLLINSAENDKEIRA